MINTTNPKFSRNIGLAVAIAAFVFYLVNMATYPFPNAWAGTLLAITGDNPFRPLSRPLWQFAMSLFSGFPGAGFLVAANLFSALCGALAVWLMYQTGYRLRYQTSRMTRDELSLVARSRWISGLISATFLAVCSAIFSVSTSANPLSLDLCLLLGAVWLMLLYRDNPSPRLWYGFALLYGLGVAEFGTFILFAPVFLIFWAWMFWKRKTFQIGRTLVGILLLITGSAIGLVFCAQYAASDVAAWREFSGFWEVVKYYLLEHYGQIRYTVPKQGWLIVLLTTILPAGYIFWNGHQEADDRFTNLGLYLFRLVLVGVAMMILFDLPGSPARVVGQGTLLVTPYAIVALWFGQLMAFFIMKLGQPRRMISRGYSKENPRPRIIFGGLLALVLIAAGILNARAASPRHGKVLAELAADLLKNLDGRPWLITQGTTDALFQWQSKAMDIPVSIINVQLARSDAYMRYLQTRIDDPVVSSSAEAGFDALLTTWLMADPGAAATMAVFGSPEVWSMRGYMPHPHRGLFLGLPADQETPPADEADLAATWAFLDRYAGRIGPDAVAPSPLAPVFKEFQRMLSLFAVYVGFNLDLQGSTADAEKGYETALRYNPDNLSALHNLTGIYSRTGRTNELASMQQRIEIAQIRQSHLQNAAAIAYVHGPLHARSLLAAQASRFMSSGLTGLGLSRLRQAMAGDQGGQSMALALSAMDRGDLPRAIQLLEETLAVQPDNVEALRFLLSAHIRSGAMDQAEATLARMEKSSIERPVLELEKAYFLVEQGQYEAATPLFMALTGDPVRQTRAWVALHQIAERTADETLLEASRQGLKSAEPDIAGLIILLKGALRDNDLATAGEYLKQALALQPGNTEVLEQGIYFDGRIGDQTALWLKVKVLLNLDPLNPLGNYVVAERHLAEDRLDLAEAALRRSLLRGTTADGLNALAWTLFLQERYPEGLSYAEQAVAREGTNPLHLSTYGMLLLNNDRPQEARDALTRAIDSVENPFAILSLHLAEIYHALGEHEQARSLVAAISPPPNGWNRYEQMAIERLGRHDNSPGEGR